MRQYPVKRIIKHLEEDNVLFDCGDVEELEPITYNEIKYLKSVIQDDYLTAFSVNMAIMYVNQGLLYAKSKLSAGEFDNYMIWFQVAKEKDIFDEDHFYFTRVNFSLHANERFFWQLASSFDIKEDSEFYELIKDVIGINDFCCYAQYDFDGDAYYHFVPKCFVEKYSSSSKK